MTLFSGCKKDDTDPTNPSIIPVQTTVQVTVDLAGASNFAILAGSAAETCLTPLKWPAADFASGI